MLQDRGFTAVFTSAKGMKKKGGGGRRSSTCNRKVKPFQKLLTEFLAVPPAARESEEVNAFN